MKKSANKRIFPSDLGDMGICCSGARLFLTSHGINWTQFVKEGLDCTQLIALGDPQLTEVVTLFLAKE
ncbi:hypothetical protein D6V26_00295 [Vibrio cholerae]|nr:hypothetical protein [Vibrio cholerae]